MQCLLNNTMQKLTHGQMVPDIGKVALTNPSTPGQVPGEPEEATGSKNHLVSSTHSNSDLHRERYRHNFATASAWSLWRWMLPREATGTCLLSVCAYTRASYSLWIIAASSLLSSLARLDGCKQLPAYFAARDTSGPGSMTHRPTNGWSASGAPHGTPCLPGSLAWKLDADCTPGHHTKEEEDEATKERMPDHAWPSCAACRLTN